METTSASDIGVGLAVGFGVLGLLGAVGLAAFGIAHEQIAAGWAFAGAMVAATLAVVAIHVYG